MIAALVPALFAAFPSFDSAGLTTVPAVIAALMTTLDTVADSGRSFFDVQGRKGESQDKNGGDQSFHLSLLVDVPR
jgi:hypothetical protein